MKYQNSINISVLSGLLLGAVLSSPVMAKEESVETRRAHFISLYDVDGDGKLNDRELHSARKAQADSNEDGRLNRDEREDIRDRREDVVDRREDVRDHREDIRDRREDRWDANHNYKPGTPAARRDKAEDVRDRREDVADRREDVRDRKENVRDRNIQRPQRNERIARTR